MRMIWMWDIIVYGYMNISGSFFDSRRGIWIFIDGTNIHKFILIILIFLIVVILFISEDGFTYPIKFQFGFTGGDFMGEDIPFEPVIELEQEVFIL